MAPESRRACWVTARGSTFPPTAWADADAAVNPRIAAAAAYPVRRAMWCPLILRRHRERRVLRQDFIALLVGDLHFQPVGALGKTLERNPLPRLDAAGRAVRIEAGAHRVGGEDLRLG